MESGVFTLSVDPEDTDIDSSGNSQQIIDMFVDVFSILLLTPYNLEAALNDFETFYQDKTIANVEQSSVLSQNIATIQGSTKSKTVIELDMNGDEINSSEKSTFAITKEEVKNILGSVEKINEKEILVADSKNKRAMIIDIETQTIKWEYISDRYIVDAHLVPYEIDPISISTIQFEEKEDSKINLGQYITWVNETANPVYIYSGDVTASDFNATFNLNRYGTIFKSNVLQIGEKYTYKFESIGDYGWFSYPNINIGKVSVYNIKVSPNDFFVLTENDGLESSYTSRVIKVNTYGNIVLKFGNSYLTNPKDARPLNNNKIIIST
jgi:hypothetical protein